MPSQGPKVRNWCFTQNHPTCMLDFRDYPSVRYAIYQHEIGEEGTDHFQGYIEFHQPVYVHTVLEIVPSSHCEPRRRTRKNAIEYCRKEDTRIDGPWEWGDDPCPGKRTDHHNVRDMIMDGKTMKEIYKKYPANVERNFNNIQKIMSLFLADRSNPTEIWVIYGTTGTGKTSWVYKKAPNVYKKPSGTKWWDGYIGQEDVLIDEFWGWLPFHYMLTLTDRYPEQVEVKGAYVTFNAKRLYITTNLAPSDWYTHPKIKENLPALWRRVDHWCAAKGFGEDLEEFDSREALEVHIASQSSKEEKPPSPVQRGYRTKPTTYDENDYQ